MDTDTIGFSGTVLTSPVTALGEGASYDRHTDTAFWFDITGRRLFQFTMDSGALTTIHLPVMASVIARIDGGRSMLATETGLHIRDARSGGLTPYLAIEADRPDTRSNDGRVHPCGALWVGTMGKKAEKGAGAIYHVLRGQLTRLFDRVTIPNAICFSPDGRTAYFTDTDLNQLMRVEIDPATALPVAEPRLFVDHSSHDDFIDGAVCDQDGVIWNARWGGGRVVAISPDGQMLKSLQVPARQTSCPAFVGRAGNRLLVTSATQGLDSEARAADPDAGRTFLLDHPVRGRFEPDFLL